MSLNCSCTLLYLSILAITCVADGTSVSSARDSEALLQEQGIDPCQRSFNLSGTVFCYGNNPERTFILQDKTGSTLLFMNSDTKATEPFTTFDIVSAAGTYVHDDYGDVCALCKEITKVGTAHPTPLQYEVISVLKSGQSDFAPRKIKGFVQDAFYDEIDPSWTYLILNDGTDRILVPVQDVTADERTAFHGSEIDVAGAYIPRPSGLRKYSGGVFKAFDKQSIKTLKPAGRLPKPTQTLDEIAVCSPEKISTLDYVKVSGVVSAAWSSDNLLLRLNSGAFCKIKLSDPPLPPIGASITATGLPETDLFNINLIRASWRPIPGKGAPSFSRQEQSLPIELSNVAFSDEDDKKHFDPRLHGKTVRVKGLLRSMTVSNDRDAQILIEAEKRIATVLLPCDCPTDLAIGSTVEICGICVMDTEPWRPNATFPTIKRILIIARSPEDIKIIRHPPWWTTRKSIYVIITLAGILGLIIFWNASLQRIIARKTHELEKQIMARIGSELKVGERTRLAVELHDALSQTLSGLASRIDAARRAANTNHERLLKHLDISAKILSSCRNDLKNCLWDLRSESLEEQDMNTAIRNTLAICADEKKLFVRFNVSRQLFSDNTMHTILLILRELVTNAVTHGNATEVRIAGSREGNNILFSVCDNGCGFDPKSCPGIEQGHFGLTGIRERLEKLNGSLNITSTPGHGTRAVMSLTFQTPTTVETIQQ